MKKSKQTDQPQMVEKKPESKDNELGFKSRDTVGSKDSQ